MINGVVACLVIWVVVLSFQVLDLKDEVKRMRADEAKRLRAQQRRVDSFNNEVTK
jgi:hypothetical protein